jgi:outer membrane lipoprotein SlyB
MQVLARALSIAMLVCVSGLALGQATVQRMRGDVEALQGRELRVKGDSGQVISFRLAATVSITTRSPVKLEAITPGAFIATTAEPQPDGTLVATELRVFPESMRGLGEGHRPMERLPGSTMTNATVTSVAPIAAGAASTMTNATVTDVAGKGTGRRIIVKYKDGEKTVVVDDSASVTRIEDADTSVLVPGAHVSITASKQMDGSLVADRITVGKNGYVPPV